MTIIYQDSFSRDWTVERLLFANPGLTRVDGWQNGYALKNNDLTEVRMRLGAQVLGSYTNTEWAFHFTLKIEGATLPTGTGGAVPVGQSRIAEIGGHVGLHLMQAPLSNGFHHYQLGLYVIQSGSLVTVYPFAQAPLLVGKTYLVEAKITVGGAGAGQVDLRILNEVGEEVFDITVSPVLTQGSIVLNTFADIFVLSGITIGHLIIADDLVGPSLVVPFNNNGAGSLTGWAVVPTGAGPNWDVADKISYDQDSYVQTSTPNARDLYSLQSFPPMPAAAVVRAIQASILARSEFDTTPPEITALWANVPQSATVHQITPAGQVVAAALTAQVHIIDENPNTTDPFVVSEMDASQLGLELL